MAATLFGQVVDDPVAVPVHFQGQFDATATGDPGLPAYINIFVHGVASPSAAAYGQSSGGPAQMTAGGFARLRPGRTYLFEVGTYSATHLRVKVTPPTGHRVFINGVEHEMFEWAMAGGAPLSPQGFFSVRLDDGSGGAVGETASLRPGRLLWFVGLGNLRNGKPAGTIRLAEDNLTANAFKPDALYFDRDAGNLNGSYAGEDEDTVVVKVNNILRQVYATTVLADIVELNDHAFAIRLYARIDVPATPGAGGVYDMAGKTPLHEFIVENPNYPALDAMRITRTVNQNGTLTMWTEMTKSTPAAGATQWLVQDWVDKTPGATVVSSPVRHRWTYSDGDRNEHLRIEDAGGAVARTIFKRYEDLNFGVETARELYYEVLGGNTDPLTTPSNAETATSVKTTYTYHTVFSDANAGNWHKVATVEGNDGSRTILHYRNEFQSRGQIFEVRRPHKNTLPSNPGGGSYGEITTFSYDFLDGFGTKRLPTRIETAVDGKTTARSDFTYAYEFITDASATYTAGNEVMPLTVATRKDYYNDTQYLTTITRVYSEDADPDHRFFPGLLHSVERPDKTMTAMAYFHSDFQAFEPFNASVTGGARVHVTLQGTSDATIGTPMTTYNPVSQPLPSNFRVVSGKSSESRVLLGEAGLQKISEKRAYLGSWVVTQQDWANHVDAIWPLSIQRRTATTGALWDIMANTWSAGRLTATVDETGVSQTFGYDPVGRTQAITRAGATGAGTTISTQTVSQRFDAAGAIISRSTTNGSETLTSTTVYDTAGRVTSQSAPGQGTTSIAYNVVNRMTTVTLPTTFSQVETQWIDGRTASVTGAATVPEYFDADVELDGRRKSTTRLNTPGDVRKQDVWTDWLGRPVRRERPGFNGATTFVETMDYDPTRGQLTLATRTGYADTRFEYNGVGERIRSGLDLSGGGLQPDSSDRIGDSDTSVESHDGAYWLTSRTWAFHQNGVDSKVLTIVVRQRLTGLSSTLRAETRSWDADNNETRRTATVDTTGRLVTITTTRPGMASAATEVRLNGMTVCATGHDGLTYRQTYDALGRLSSVIDPRTGSATGGTYLYQANTPLVYQRRDASNRVVATTTYDNAGRPVFTQNAATGTVRTSYNERGQVAYRWGSAGYPVSYTYDGYGQRTHQRTYRDPNSTVGNYWEAETWPGGAVGAAVTEWDYDSYSGLLKKKYDPSRQFVEFTYNERGQTHERFWARNYGGQRVKSTYDYVPGTGELSSITYTDTTPSVTYGAYTRLGQPTSVSDYTGTRTFAYSETAAPWRQTAENLSAFYGSRSLATLFETATTANTGNSTYTGHTLGSVNGRYAGYRLGINPNASSYELEQSYAASSADRLAGLVVKRANGSASRQFVYGYETNSSLFKTLSVVGNGFHVTRSFETSRDLLLQIDTRWNGATRTSYAYQYNDLGQRSTVVQSGGVGEAFEELGTTHQRFSYNPRGELTSARSYHGSDPASTANPLTARLHDYDYDVIGNRKWSNASGDPVVRDDYTADDKNQYTQRENNTLAVQGTASAIAKVAVSGPLPTPAGGQVLAGRPTGGNYWGSSLVVANETGPFSGNVTAYAVLPGAGPAGKDLFRVESKAAWLPPVLQAFAYDADGNLIGDGLWTYDWDAENRLIRMTTTPAAANAGRPNLELNFRYDYRHRRVFKEVRNVTTSVVISERRFLYDGWNLIAETDGANAFKRSYAWGADLDGIVQGAGGVGGLLQIHDYEQNKTMFPAYDGNGNIAALVNADTGAVEASYEYSPFGELQRCAGAYATANPFRFSSKWQDEETGLIYFGVRYYSPREGRFLGRDPIEEAGGVNLYGFCGNDAINGIDYLGYTDPIVMETVYVGAKAGSTFGPVGTVVGGAIGAVLGFTGLSKLFGFGKAASSAAAAKPAKVFKPAAAQRSPPMFDANGNWWMNGQQVWLGSDGMWGEVAQGGMMDPFIVAESRLPSLASVFMSAMEMTNPAIALARGMASQYRANLELGGGHFNAINMTLNPAYMAMSGFNETFTGIGMDAHDLGETLTGWGRTRALAKGVIGAVGTVGAATGITAVGSSTARSAVLNRFPTQVRASGAVHNLTSPTRLVVTEKHFGDITKVFGRYNGELNLTRPEFWKHVLPHRHIYDLANAPQKLTSNWRKLFEKLHANKTTIWPWEPLP